MSVVYSIKTLQSTFPKDIKIQSVLHHRQRQVKTKCLSFRHHKNLQITFCQRYQKHLSTSEFPTVQGNNQEGRG